MGGFFQRNWGYKLVSVFLAVLLWLWVSNTQIRAENSLAIPLQEKGLPINLIATSKIPTTISVRLQGTANALTVKDLTAYIDYSGATKGQKSYPVVINEPAGVKVLSVEPASINVTFDELKEKSFPVILITQGAVDEGYETGKAIIRPSTVTVRGPEQKLVEIDQVFVEVPLGNATDSISNTYPVRFKDAGGNPITGPDPTRQIVVAQPESVSVIIPVVKKELASQTVPVKAVAKGSPAAGFMVGQIITSPSTVRIFGTQDKLKGIDSINAGSVDVTGANQDVMLEVKPENLNLPAGVSLEQGVKINIIVKISPAPKSKTLTGIPITVKNLAAGQAAISKPSLDITITGSPDKLDALKESDIVLWVDAAGVGPGQEKQSQVFAQLPPGIEISALPTVTISVK